MVTETVPLGRLLRVEVVLVIEGDALSDPFDAVLERFAAESCMIEWREYSYPADYCEVLKDLPGGLRFSISQFKHTRSPV